MTSTVTIPKGPCLIVLVGPSGAGKSTFANNHFEPREVVSMDDLREWLTGDHQRTDKDDAVVAEFNRRIECRLRAGQRVVADATHIRNSHRRRTAEIGFLMDVPVYYVMINRPVLDKMRTGGWRNDVRTSPTKTLIISHEETFVANESTILSGDGFKWVTVIDTRRDDTMIRITKVLKRDHMGALLDLHHAGFNHIRVIGDVHGNLSGLRSILSSVTSDTFCLFLGDVVDYGTQSWECVDIIERMVSHGVAAMVRGNHDRKIARYVEQTMNGGEFTGNIGFGNDVTINQLKAMHPDESRRIQVRFLGLVEQSPDWIELGDWLFVHAAVAPDMFANPLFRAAKNSRLESMALYGETDGTFDARGYPVRTYDWINKVPGRKHAVLGHQILSVIAPVEQRTSTGGRLIFLDTGSAKGLGDLPGFLSYLDMEIEFNKSGDLFKLVPHETYGRE